MAVFDRKAEPHTPPLLRELEEKARAIRRDSLIMTTEAGSGHPGGSLSCADLLSVLYFHHLRYDPSNPGWEGRDRFILSKGHACPALYSALSLAGFFPREWLRTLRRLGSPLQGHPDSTSTPGVEASTGSLGQGLSIGCGMALAGRLDRRDYRVYVLMGDGELDEGQVWEAAMFAAHQRLDNLVGIVDRNRIQLDGFTEEIVGLEPLAEKWRAFGWNVVEVDGHDLRQVAEALDGAEGVKGKPTVLLARTVKGKGVSFMENQVKYHGTPLTREELERALEELGG
ncbi:MAG: transketolase [Candidatus Hadarchaeales archaeon]